MGKRLGKYTKDNTKCMVPVNGVRLIDRMLEQLASLDLKRVVMVVGYKGKELMSYIGDRYADRLTIEYINNPIYDKTNNIYSLALAKDKLREDDTLLLESDLIFEKAMLDKIVKHPERNLALVAKYETWMDGTMVRIDNERNIVNFVPKKAFRYEDVGCYYKTCNIYKFSRDFLNNEYLPFLEAYMRTMGNNEYYEQVLRVLTLMDHSNLKALPIDGERWYEIDDVQDLDIAETLFADNDHLMERYNKRYGGHWRFPRLLDYCYLVNPYFPTKRMKDEMRANFDTLLSEYPSGMYVQSLLAAKYFNIRQEYAVAGNGAAELIKSLMEMQSGKVGVVYPTFEEYPHRLEKSQIVSYVPKNENLQYGEEELRRFFADKGISLLLLINPDNPSGNFIPVSDVIRLGEWCKERDILFVVDESFVDFSDDFERNSLITDSILESNSHLVVVKSISKSYGVPGLRLGVAASSDTALIAKLRKDVSIWNINSFAEFYMQIFGKYAADYKTACRKFIAERSRFASLLQGISFLRVIPTQANYFCCEVKSRYTSAELTRVLLRDYNILVKDCDTKTSLEGKNFIRISIRDTKDNDTMICALKELDA